MLGPAVVNASPLILLGKAGRLHLRHPVAFATTIDARLSALEREVAEIKRFLRSKTGLAELWWERIGAFEDDLVF